MFVRMISIVAVLALACSIGFAQATMAPSPASSGAAAGTSPGVGGAAAVPGLAPPGEANTPLGVNIIGGATTTNVTGTTTGQFPAAFNGIVGPAQSYPLIQAPTVHFENAADGVHTVPVISYGGGPSGAAASNLPNSANAGVASGPSQMVDLNLGNVSSIADLYGGPQQSLGEVARTYKTRRNGVQNARVYTNADINRIRSEGGEGASNPTAMPAGSMPASDRAAEQNAQPTTPQVPAPVQNQNQKPSPFSPKQ